MVCLFFLSGAMVLFGLLMKMDLGEAGFVAFSLFLRGVQGYTSGCLYGLIFGITLRILDEHD